MSLPCPYHNVFPDADRGLANARTSDASVHQYPFTIVAGLRGGRGDAPDTLPQNLSYQYYALGYSDPLDLGFSIEWYLSIVQFSRRGGTVDCGVLS